ncbi:MAG TPA: hypothetical protein DCE55_29245 [Planctomycetaceae bacterium]|nr:hypothetical protein [Planctomycetaceae bacterium]|tara:strand:- start:18384 stop:18743 length:360 start_codon:yes stop_codon:yes gene_type:complete
MIDSELLDDILRKSSEGQSQRAIASDLQIHRSVVERVLRNHRRFKKISGEELSSLVVGQSVDRAQRIKLDLLILYRAAEVRLGWDPKERQRRRMRGTEPKVETRVVAADGDIDGDEYEH